MRAIREGTNGGSKSPVARLEHSWKLFPDPTTKETLLTSDYYRHTERPRYRRIDLQDFF